MSLTNALNAAVGVVPNVSSISDAPLAVQGSAPGWGLFAFGKFSSCPFLIDAIRDDVRRNANDASRRIFVVPRTEVTGLLLQGGATRELQIAGQAPFSVPQNTSVVLANGTIEATRVALQSLGVGNSAFGSPRVGNLMAHLRSNVIVRIPRTMKEVRCSWVRREPRSPKTSAGSTR